MFMNDKRRRSNIYQVGVQEDNRENGRKALFK